MKKSTFDNIATIILVGTAMVFSHGFTASAQSTATQNMPVTGQQNAPAVVVKKNPFTTKASKLSSCLVAAGYKDKVHFRIKLVEEDVAGIKTVVGMQAQFQNSLRAVAEHQANFTRCTKAAGGKV